MLIDIKIICYGVFLLGCQQVWGIIFFLTYTFNYPACKIIDVKLFIPTRRTLSQVWSSFCVVFCADRIVF